MRNTNMKKIIAVAAITTIVAGTMTMGWSSVTWNDQNTMNLYDNYEQASGLTGKAWQMQKYYIAAAMDAVNNGYATEQDKALAASVSTYVDNVEAGQYIDSATASGQVKAVEAVVTQLSNLYEATNAICQRVPPALNLDNNTYNDTYHTWGNIADANLQLLIDKKAWGYNTVLTNARAGVDVSADLTALNNYIVQITATNTQMDAILKAAGY